MEILLLGGLLVLGLGLRLIDLSDPPLDFHPVRQLRAAIIARAFYYEGLPDADPQKRELAVNLSHIQEPLEPPILEKVVAWTYRLVGGERLWVPRVYSSLFWIIGGIALYALARRITSPGAALAALAFYLVLPYGVQASRSFQPDPMMVMWTLLEAYALYRWGEKPSWKWALLAGIFGGLAVLIKVVAVFPVVGMLAAVALSARGLRKALVDWQVWAIGAIVALIPLGYYLLLAGSNSVGLASGTLSISLALLRDTRFYVRWLNVLNGIMSLPLVVLGALSALLFPNKGRALLVGWWMGYGVFGLVFAYRISTHDYYSLPLIPIVALSLAGAAWLLLRQWAQQPPFWKLVFVGLAICAMAYPAWIARSILVGNDYRGEPGGWRQIGEAMPRDGAIIGLTHDYGFRMSYYGWIQVSNWPDRADLNLDALQGRQEDFDSLFDEKTRGMSYFLVTRFDELDAQPLLKSMLYDHYPLIQEGDGYILFDLSQPLNLAP